MTRRTYTPKYPYTLLREALDAYRAEVFRDDEARNRFLTHIQPMVRQCVGRAVGTYGGAIARRSEDVVGFVNVKLLEAWLPAYFASKRKVERVLEAIRYLSKSIRGYVITYIKKTYDPRIILVDVVHEVDRVFDRRADQEELDAAYDRMFAEHVALRPRPDLDFEVVRKLLRYLVWKEYKETDGVSG